MLALILLSAPAMAAEGSGALVVRGVDLPPGASLDAPPAALYVGNASWVEGFTLDLPDAQVTLYQKRFRHVETPAETLLVEDPTAARRETWTVRGATLRILGEGAGLEQPRFVGIYPVDGQVQVASTAQSSVTARKESAFGSAPSSDGTDPRDMHYFVHERRPHLHAKVEGAVAYVGLGAAKLSGLKVEIASPDGTRVHDTGERATGPGETTVTFLYVRFDAPATMALSTGGTFVEMTALAAVAEGEGRATLDVVQGEIRTPAGTYSPPSRPGQPSASATLDGRFRLDLAPLSGGETARVALEGDFETTGLAFRPAPGSPLAPDLPGAALLLVGAALLAGGGAGAALLVRRRRQAPPAAAAQLPFTPEDCAAAARLAMESEDWAEAAEWFRRALALAPTSARLEGDLAFALHRLGGTDEAIAHFARAHELSNDGEAAFNATVALLEAGHAAEEAEPWIVRALERSPETVLQMDEGPGWRELRARPSVADAEARAWSRLAEGEDGPGRGG